MAASQHKV